MALFERDGRGVRLSPAGEAALGAIARLFDQAEGVFELLSELAGEPSTTLRVAASDYLGKGLLVPVIRQMLEKRAPVRFAITTANSVDAARGGARRGGSGPRVGVLGGRRPREAAAVRAAVPLGGAAAQGLGAGAARAAQARAAAPAGARQRGAAHARRVPGSRADPAHLDDRRVERVAPCLVRLRRARHRPRAGARADRGGALAARRRGRGGSTRCPSS